MLNLSFKAVGHGDAIVLEWGNEVGIIDCCRAEPVITHLRDKGHKKIAFMILSHPHIDHFGGFKTLIQYCQKQKIEISRFLHTAPYDPGLIGDKFFIHQTELSRRKLVGLYRLLQRLKEQGTFVSVIKNNFPEILLDEKHDLSMKILAPGDSEQGAHMAPFYAVDEVSTADPSKTTNLLSTVLQIYTLDWQVLLTSDAEESSLMRIIGENDLIGNKALAVGQVPHHGAIKNHAPQFWQSLSNRNQSIISVGDNAYRHPHYEVVKFFDKDFTDVHATSPVEGYQLYFGYPGNLKDERLRYHENEVSTPGSDQNFIIHENGRVEHSS